MRECENSLEISLIMWKNCKIFVFIFFCECIVVIYIILFNVLFVYLVSYVIVVFKNIFVKIINVLVGNNMCIFSSIVKDIFC